MVPDIDSHARRVGLFLNLAGERRGEFQSACGELFNRLLLAETFDGAQGMLARETVDLLVLDLEGHEDHGDLLSAANLVRARHGAPVLVLCPYSKTSWLPELMGAGPLSYRISPILSDELQQAVGAALAVPLDAAANAQQQLLDKEKELRDLLTVQRSVQRALTGMDELQLMASQICVALCSFPGVRHTALFHMKERGNLRLEAQESRNHLDLVQLLGRGDNLLQTPQHDAFPPLLAVSSGDLVLLDAPEKGGDPMLAMGLHDCGVRMVLAMPLRSEPGGPVLGAVSMMFDRPLQFSREQFSCFGSLAQFISFGLAMSELKHQNDALAGQLTQITTTDALTGAVNRRHGENALDNEIRRARRYGIPLGVISFDIDNFRSVNDIYGYPCGDQALRTVAHTVQSRLRTSDTLVRMRGEEFLIIATHTSAIDALKLAEKLRETIASTELPGCDAVTISLGVAQAGPEEGASTLLERLDAALHRAKRAGRNCVELAMAS
ncbi:GGDEF domain-containing protein [Pseudoduganella namucuonensis]|uniref:diguanylate cyclase n=1 Tax=Pseudoduganella namucuonensis TaxID=1035707 RepID=A0A1I7GUJ3_9BURK|nr:GGDEF domain-containing protein [Pseudoduganella namucuonensis]SFU52100.1 diguanylate cyclase (GGDEF) domain-containing protein [Pseudoduganella namucuonensis]